MAAVRKLCTLFFVMVPLTHGTALPSSPIITPAPELAERQDPSARTDFVGYRPLDGGIWTPIYCGQDATFSEWVSWGRCCPIASPNACAFVTSCNEKTIFGVQGASSTCEDIVRSVIVYDDLSDPNPVTIYACINWNGSVYRETISIASSATEQQPTNVPSRTSVAITTESSLNASPGFLTSPPATSNTNPSTISRAGFSGTSSTVTQSRPGNPQNAAPASGLSQSDKIALGTGISIPLAAIIVAIVIWRYPRRVKVASSSATLPAQNPQASAQPQTHWQQPPSLNHPQIPPAPWNEGTAGQQGWYR
ncbi:hypothetical protein BCR34DRAFT_607540 [Clohesyomyces aquaticus]|uniref:Mid2 domain-containing protein n=1 Tax=Clohesyomyces aquaticus TaxID=1231657 RepID=A0A1Y1YFC5_9PLEO|nr:hypothetical protein BCR34DRAFT_607540 [Clohesyomyces aquaticus]